MFGSMQRRWEMKRLMARLETARNRKEVAMEAFVSGRVVAPIIAPSASWSRRITEQPDASHVADVIEECEQLEAELARRMQEYEEID